MAEAVVSFALETIGSLLIEEEKFLHGVSDKVKQLQLELNRMRSFLKDADARQREEETVKEWISQARDLAYEADDLIESYAFKVASRRGRGVGRVLKRCVCILNECYASHRVGEEIQILQTEISDLTKSFQEYGIRAMMEREHGSSSLEQQLRRTYSHVIEDDFVGLESDVELLVENLVMENEIHNFGVVSIVGMGGLGKTTLARKVYNHRRVKRYFDSFVWVCISQNWKKEDILRQILTRLVPDKRKEIMKWRDEELIRQLFQIQQNRRCLLVLDDIWSVDAWESIKQAFSIRNGRNKILLTTRNRDVAIQIDPNGFHHQPRLLSDDESWELLQMKALRERSHQDHEDIQKMEKLGKEMVKACGGLPLGVIVLGGILATKMSLNEWETVYKNTKAYLGRGSNMVQEQGNVHKILALSYNDLPHKLKSCFLYLGTFGEDSDIDAETLYQLWMAEGMISKNDRINEETMMDVAERYLGELIERCMVQGKTHEILSDGRFASCRIHDLMRDLILVKAKEENFFLLINSEDGFDEENAINSSLTHQVHRLVVRLSGKSVSEYVPLEKRITRHLRSLALLILDEYEGRMPQTMKSQFKQFKMLRVLTIEGLSCLDLDQTSKNSILKFIDQWKLLKSFSKIIHLRYLCLRSDGIMCLPSSISNLQHLQTLDIRHSDLVKIPNVLWKMRQLRHLYLPIYFGVVRLCKLRLDGLNKLEILKNFHSHIFRSKDISKLKNLRALAAEVDLDNEDPTEIIGYMSNLKNLRRAYLSLYSEDQTMKEQLSAAVGRCFSCCILQELKVHGSMDKLPNYETRFCSGLTKIELIMSKIREDPMQILEKLPNLRLLILRDRCFLGKEMQCNATGFPQLSFLDIKSLPNLEKWRVDEGAMPNLRYLAIALCEKLEMVPNGLRFITTLKELNIIHMPREFTDRIQVVDGREGEDFDKVSHIPSVTIIGEFAMTQDLFDYSDSDI